MNLLRFIHFLGIALWLGGGLAAMMLRVGAKRETPEVRAGAIRLAASLHGGVIGPGVLLTLASGLALSMRLAGSGAMNRPGMMGMQGAGLLAGILVLFVAIPTAKKLARAAVPTPTGELPPIVEELRRRQAMISSIAGVLALVALVCAELP